jgi:Ca2+-binding RTX toxin-like protein
MPLVLRRGEDDPEEINATTLHEEIQAEGGDDTACANDGNDLVYGGQGNDRLFGGNGDDTLAGGAGYDDHTGGSGADTFLFAAFDGSSDLVRDFETGTDILRFRALALPGSAPGTPVLSIDTLTGTGAQFFCNTVSGDLVWDANGVLTGGDMIVVTLWDAPALAATDIVLF